MTWMSDERHFLMQDTKEKKVTARSARHTRTHNGKGGPVKFPSDYLTKKELKAMSGECIKYASLKVPMSWDEFKALPNDLKKEYITSIRDRFDAPDKYIAEMLGVSCHTLGLHLRDIGLGVGKNGGHGNRKWKKESFYAWRSGVDETATQPAVIDADEPTEEPSSSSGKETNCCSIEKVRAIPRDGQLIFNCPTDQALNMLATILGDTNVELFVEWRVIDDMTTDTTIDEQST